MSAELKFNDGTVVKISDETEAELRKAFGPKEKEVEVYTFYAGKDEDYYKLALQRPYKDEIFPDHYSGRAGFTKYEIERIIAGLQDLIEVDGLASVDE